MANPANAKRGGQRDERIQMLWRHEHESLESFADDRHRRPRDKVRSCRRNIMIIIYLETLPEPNRAPLRPKTP